MITEPYDGGSAFPHDFDKRHPSDTGYEQSTGMSLRDWFAGQALSYVAEFHGQDLYKPNGPRDIASRSYAIADAMLAERAP